MKKTGFKSIVALICAALVSVGAAVVRCIQLFYYTDMSTGIVLSSGRDLIADLYICIGVSIFLFAFASFAFFNKSTSEFDFVPGRGMFLASLLSAAGMFYDFIYQCVNCYNYIAKTAYPALNRIIPMIACAVFALLSCAYFAVLCQCSRSSRFEFSRLWLLRLTPLFWAFCNALLGLTEYGDVIYDVDSALRYLAVIFGLVFFFLLSASREKASKHLGPLVFFGYSYGALCFMLSFPRMVAFIAGEGLPAADYSAPTFLFTGIFAFAAALEISFKKKA